MAIKKAFLGTDEEYRELARLSYHEDGIIEIDNDAKVSKGEDGGAYVQAWVWIETPIPS